MAHFLYYNYRHFDVYINLMSQLIKIELILLANHVIYRRVA